MMIASCTGRKAPTPMISSGISGSAAPARQNSSTNARKIRPLASEKIQNAVLNEKAASGACKIATSGGL